MILRLILLAAIWCGVCGVSLTAQDPYARAETLAAAREFDQAEAEYRERLRERPQDWRLRLGLARVVLWDGRYGEAERHFEALIAERPTDENALLGYAQAAYWWGDYRAARERFTRLLEVLPDHAEARQALSDLAILSAPRYDVSATYLDDSQPYDFSMTRALVSWFSDPLTRWDVRGAFGNAAGGETTMSSAGLGVATAFPRWKVDAEGWLESFRFPDGERELIGDLVLRRRLPLRSSVSLSVARNPLLSTAVSVDDHATATRYAIGWQRELTATWLAALNVYGVDYSDENRGAGADAWFLAPLLASGAFSLRGGLSAAWRDTELNRFRFTAFEANEIVPGEWQYRYTGVYDPYWTPHDLREARLVIVAEWPWLKIHADGGYARDRALGFGPGRGPTPVPFFVFPEVQERSFRPWRAGIELTWPIVRKIELRTRYRHDVTVFYRANEFEASLGGRL